MKATKQVTFSQAGADGSFSAVVATLGVVDLDGDVILPGAFSGRQVWVLPAHDSQHVPLGKARILERGGEAVAVGEFNLALPAARDWHAALAFDLAHGRPLQQWSFSFQVLEDGRERRGGREVRLLRRLEEIEVSPVLRGAGIATRTTCAGERCKVAGAAYSGVRGAGEGRCGCGGACCSSEPVIASAVRALRRFEAEEREVVHRTIMKAARALYPASCDPWQTLEDDLEMDAEERRHAAAKVEREERDRRMRAAEGALALADARRILDAVAVEAQGGCRVKILPAPPSWEGIVARAAAELSIATPVVKAFRAARHNEVGPGVVILDFALPRGFYDQDSGTVYARADLVGEEAVKALLHETHHALEDHQGRLYIGRWGAADSEYRASEFARLWTRGAIYDGSASPALE